MRSYIKIYGPPVLKAIKALEKLAVDTPQVCIMDPILYEGGGMTDRFTQDPGALQDYFYGIGASLTMERCSKIISKSAEMLGDYDFFFEWFKNPTQTEINELMEKIDEALTPLGCRYTMTTR